MVPVNGINRAVVQAINFGRAFGADLRAVYVTDDMDKAEELRARWDRQLPDVPAGRRRVAVSARSSRRSSPTSTSSTRPGRPDREAPITIVVLPEYVARHWWDRLLYNQTAKRLKAALVGREHTVIADVPYRRGH